MELPSLLDAGHGALPKGYGAVAVTLGQRSSPLRVCVLVRNDPAEVVLLRDTPLARVYLACVCDASDRVRQWAELWVQEPPTHATGGLSVARETLTNQATDAQWDASIRLGESIDGVLLTGWEHEGPGAIFLDTARGRPIHPVDPSGQPLVLCRDDVQLLTSGLPAYSTTGHRYLYLRDIPNSPFVPVTPGSPTHARTKPLADFLPRGTPLLALNPAGSPMRLLPYSPFKFTDYLNRLDGSAWSGPPGDGLDRPGADGAAAVADDADPFGGWLLLGRQGQRGRFVEAFHLKIRLLLELIEQVRASVKALQRPLLNISPDSFQIDLGNFSAAAGLPVLWSTRARLVDPGDAIALDVPAGDVTYFLPSRGGGMSIYRPSPVGQRYVGRGQFQIRKLIAGPAGSTTLEATLATREHVVAACDDLLWLPLRLSQRVDVYARLEPQDNIATGELHFQTVPQRFDDATTSALRSAEGVFMPEVPFEIVPLLSSPCDLYSLCVLGVQTMLLGPGGTLAQSLAELGTLARHLAREHDPSTPLHLRLQAVFAAQPALLDALGPQRLVRQPLTPAQALAILPEELWWDALAVLVTMLPGFGPDSTCAALGDAPPGRLHQVFDPSIAALRSLVTRSRSLLLIDWTSNREIRAVIEKIRA